MNAGMESCCVVLPARWPEDETAAAALLRNYGAYLAAGPNGTAHIDASGLLSELKSLPLVYREPDSVLLLAWTGNAAAGCVAVKHLHTRPGTCEMKRLWTEPAFRGLGVGRSLAEAAIAWTSAQGAEVLLLDTQPEAMPQAVALYRALGFTETTRYNDNPVPGLFFMELRLHLRSGTGTQCLV